MQFIKNCSPHPFFGERHSAFPLGSEIYEGVCSKSYSKALYVLEFLRCQNFSGAGTLPAPALPMLTCGEEPAVVGSHIRLWVTAPHCGNGCCNFVGLHHYFLRICHAAHPSFQATPREWVEEWASLRFPVWRCQGPVCFARDQAQHDEILLGFTEGHNSSLAGGAS